MNEFKKLDWKRMTYEYTPSNDTGDQMLKIFKMSDTNEPKVVGIYFGSQADELKEFVTDMFDELRNRQVLIDEYKQYAEKAEDKKHRDVFTGFCLGMATATCICVIEGFLNKK